MVYDKKVEVLTLQEEPAGNFTWIATGRVWAHTELQTKLNIFSKLGLGATSMLFSIQPCHHLTLHNAFMWRGQHYLITSVNMLSPVSMEVLTAAVVPARFVGYRIITELDALKRPENREEPIAHFPAVLTEKYLSYSQDVPMVQTETTYILVTPKGIRMQVGNTVADESGQKYVVRVCHMLDAYKNEYEIYREDDV